MTLDECLESCVRMKKCMAFTHLDKDNSCKLFNFFPDLGGEEKEIPCKGPCVTRYIGLPQFCYTISTDYPFYRQHVHRLEDCNTYGILCKNHYMLQDEVNRSRLELQKMKKDTEDEVNRSRLELQKMKKDTEDEVNRSRLEIQKMKKENEDMTRYFEEVIASQMYEVQEKIAPLRQVLFKLNPAILIQEEKNSRQTTLISFATQIVSEVETLKSLIEINSSNPKDNDDLKSSANRMEKLIKISAQTVTFIQSNSAKPTQTGEEEDIATIDRLDGWKVSLDKFLDALDANTFIEMIDFAPEVAIDMLSDLKDSCQYFTLT